MLRQDNFDQDINIGDVVVWGTSSRYAGIEKGMVTRYTPKKIQTTGGQVDPSNCMVVTEQYKVNLPKDYEAMLTKAKPLFEDISKDKPKVAIRYAVSVSFYGENQMPASGKRTYHGFELHVRVLEDKQYRHKIPSHACVTHAGDYRHSYNISREYYEKVTNSWGGTQWKRNGKMKLDDRWTRKSDDTHLTAKMVTQLLGHLPEDDVTLKFATASELVTSLNLDVVTLVTQNEYGRGLNSLGLAIGQSK